jgi:hypothetical protein
METHSWRPISTAPRDEFQFVMLFVPSGLESGPVTMGCYFRPELRDELGRFQPGRWYPADWRGWFGIDGDGLPSWCEPTHWMPMPDGPETAE